MKRMSVSAHISKALTIVSPSFLCCAFFVIGAVIGLFFSQSLSSEVLESIRVKLQQTLSAYAVKPLAAPPLVSVAVTAFFFSALSFLCGFSSLGFICILFLSSFYGFTLSFSVSVFIVTLGRQYYPISLCLYAICSALRLPAFLIVSNLAFKRSKSLFSNIRHRNLRFFRSVTRSKLIQLAIALSLICLSICVELIFVPKLLYSLIINLK